MTPPTEPLARAERELLWRFAPHPQRDRLRVLFGIEQELQQSLNPSLDHSVAHARLGWWQDELQRLKDDQPRHPLTQSLATIANQQGLPPPDLTGLVTCASIDLACLAFETRADLDSYLQASASAVFCVATAMPLAWGCVLRELELLHDFSAHAWQGRIYWCLGQDPAAADPWRARPLGESEAEALRQRMLELEQRLRDHCRASGDTTTASPALAKLWSALTLLRAQRARRALPHAHEDTRFDPLALTLSLWWSAVQIQLGKQPRIL